MQTRPDILVLGGGGFAGEAWMTGVLAGLEDASGVQLSECEYFVGTSAGAVVAARLAGGAPLRRPLQDDDMGASPSSWEGGRRRTISSASHEEVPPGRALALVVKTGATAVGAVPADLGLRASERLRRRGGKLVLRATRPETGSVGELVEQWEVGDGRFDGRLRIVAVERGSGRRVVFGSPGAPDASVAEAVAASCTVPWLFAPTVIGGVEYLDGGVWSSTNIDVAPNARGAHVLCLAPRASLHGPLAVTVRALVRSVASVEAAALRARGGRVRLVAPDGASAIAMGPDFMAPEPVPEIFAAGYAQGLAL